MNVGRLTFGSKFKLENFLKLSLRDSPHHDLMFQRFSFSSSSLSLELLMKLNLLRKFICINNYIYFPSAWHKKFPHTLQLSSYIMQNGRGSVSLSPASSDRNPKSVCEVHQEMFQSHQASKTYSLMSLRVYPSFHLSVVIKDK